jgi:hypothetical protein
MSDLLGLKGFAQILPRQSGGSSAMLSQMMRMKQNEAELADKKMTRDQEWYDKNMVINKGKDMYIQLDKIMTPMLIKTKDALDKINYQAMKSGGHTPETRYAMSQIKSNYDAFMANVQSYNDGIKEIADMADKDTKGVLNGAAVTDKLQRLKESAFRYEKDGSVSINEDVISELNSLKSDYKMYDTDTLNKNFIEKDMGTIDNIVSERDAAGAGAVTTGVVTSSSNLYSGKIGFDGTLGLEPTPVAVKAYDSDPIRKKWLDQWTEEMAKEDPGFKRAESTSPEEKKRFIDSYRATAFKKNVADPHGVFEIKSVSIRTPSEKSISDAMDKKSAFERFDKLKVIVTDPNQGEKLLGMFRTENTDLRYEAGGIQLYTRGVEKGINVTVGGTTKDPKKWTKVYDQPLPLNDSTLETLANHMNEIKGNKSFSNELIGEWKKAKGYTDKVDFGFVKK